MDKAEGWQPMQSAPRDGSRILVTLSATEQGPAQVDVAYWARADRLGMGGWRAFDSEPGQMFAYQETELKCWMPMPGAGEGAGSSMPEPWQGEEAELFGSGI